MRRLFRLHSYFMLNFYSVKSRVNAFRCGTSETIYFKPMKSKFFNSLMYSGALLLAMTACTKNNDASDSESTSSLKIINVSSEGITTYNVSNLCTVYDSTAVLTADQIEFLYAVREDEKIGKDFYAAMLAKFPAERQFIRFSQSEINHIAAIENLLNYYEIQYPVLGNPGVFADSARQAKYIAMIAAATDSMAAYQVAAALEEENYVAYREVAKDTSNYNVHVIMKHLAIASENHLRALVHRITLMGGTYTPQLLTQSEFDQVIHNPFDRGDKERPKGARHQDTNSEKNGKPEGPKGRVDGNGNCVETTNGSQPTPGLPGGEPGRGYRYGGGHR